MIARVVVLIVGAVALAHAQSGPDLQVYQPTLAENVHEELKAISSDACVLQPADHCVDAPGVRKLLRFSVLAVNRGDTDLFVGKPSPDNPLFVFSQCHNHYHFESFARYELRARNAPTVVRTGQKRSFCIEDLHTDPDHPLARPCLVDHDCVDPVSQQQRGLCSNGVCAYNCTFQGIQPGRGDIYESNLDCQWIDTTDVPPGDYDLWVLLNTEHILPETNYDNDAAMVPVTVGPPAGAPVPVVHVHARKKTHVGKRLSIRWKARLSGGRRELSLYDVWLSRDGGATFELLATGLDADAHHFLWVADGAATSTAVIRVDAWTKALAHGSGATKTLQILP